MCHKPRLVQLQQVAPAIGGLAALRKFRLHALTVCFAGVLGLAPAQATVVPDGYYDPTWAGAGRIAFPADVSNPNFVTSASGLLIESNGNVLVAGTVSTPDYAWWLGELSGSGQYVGEFVPTFALSDGSGRVTACELGFPCSGNAEAFSAVVAQPDGKYLVASQNRLWRTGTKASSLDTAGVSGGTGFVSRVFSVNDVGGKVFASGALALLPDGKILAGGFGYYSGTSSTSVFGVVRLKTDLSLDTTFNSMMDAHGVTFAGGAVITLSAADTTEEFVQAILLQTDGRILLAGYGVGGAGGRFEAVRLNADGSLDTSYGSSGTAVLSWPGGVFNPESMALIDGANRVLVPFSGQVYPSGTQVMLVLRVGSDGAPDTTFNGTGFAFNTNQDTCSATYAYALALDSAGRIVVSGNCYDASQTNDTFAVLRLRADTGTLDTSFGISGWSFGAYDPANGMNSGSVVAFDASGRPIVAGTTAASLGQGQGGASRLTYDLIRTNNFENVPRGCLPPDC